MSMPPSRMFAISHCYNATWMMPEWPKGEQNHPSSLGHFAKGVESRKASLFSFTRNHLRLNAGGSQGSRGLLAVPAVMLLMLPTLRTSVDLGWISWLGWYALAVLSLLTASSLS